MGMIYKGVEYHYAFEFNIPAANGDDDRPPFDIVISNFREKFQDFAGLCLNNELKVISIQPIIFAAFFDIVSQIVDITIQSEKAYAKIYKEKTLTPLMKVEDPVFLGQFSECRKNKKSLDWYEKLKKYVEGEEFMPESVQKEKTKIDVFDINTISYFNYFICKEALPVKDVGFFRIGESPQFHG